ncbi:hypothetical protein [Nitrosomonas sp. Nm34]|uniref:hypothetical protein n=1 Tax=Nitrosomonas sp. Nm34 TaxID=1881055 RepID=UPI0008F26EAC|nr:hypothetical protein [Nitrosomonas sp. Nm34]SFI58238.1 hypothetical protein SAMN05428978_101828 [Nitrosomonas sp. Nm34]
MIYSPNIKQRPTIVKKSLSSLCVLQKLAPPQAIIHIGAGDGYGEMHQWRQWDVSHALLIDANEDRLEWARPLIAENPSWYAISAVLSENEGEIDYYQASNPEEDGLISPQRLSSLWPNLHTTDQSVCPSRRLDHLLAEDIGSTFAQADSIWVFVDCLPALPILRGAGIYIEQWNVLKLRVLLHPAAEIEEDAALQSIETYLQPLGFQCVEITESNHPAIGYALFARSWKRILHSRTETLGKANAILTDEVLALVRQQEALNQDVAALSKAYEEQEALVDIHLVQIESLTQERNSYASQAAERQAQIDTLGQANIALNADAEALAQEKSALTAQYKALQQEVAALSQARDEQNELVSQHLVQIEALTQECVKHASQSAERQAQIDTLGQANIALNDGAEALALEKSILVAQYEALKQETTALSQARDEQNELISQYLAQIEALVQEKSALATQYEILKQEVAVLSKARDEQSALANQRKVQIEALTQQCDRHNSQATQLQTQIDTLTQTNVTLKAEKEEITQEKIVLATQRDTLKQEVATLSKAFDEQSILANQSLTQERDSHASQAAKLHAQINTLKQANIALETDKGTITKEKLELAAQHDALKQEMSVLSMAHYEQSALADQRQTQIDALTQTNIALDADKKTIDQERTLLAARYEALQQEVAALSKARDEQSALANQHKAQTEALMHERDSHANQAMQLQTQIVTLTQTNNSLNDEKKAIAQEKSVLARQQEALKQEIVALRKARDEQSALANQRQEQLEVLAQERDSHANQATQLQAQINTFTQTDIALKADKEALIKEKSALTAQKKTLKQEVTALNKARNEQRALADQRKKQIDTLTRNNVALKAEKEALIQERLKLSAQFDAIKQEVTKLNRVCDEQGTLAHQRLAQIDILTQDQAEQTKLVAQYKTELEQLQLKLRQSSVRITQLESELAENNTRQHLINEEMIKAEAQIELIKDVLLREPGL